MNSWISTLGLYNYDESLFDELQLPDGVDKEVLIDNLLIETAELEILYADFDIMKKSIGVWSRKELSTWNKLDELFKMEYNPIYNVDATESTTEERDLKHTNENLETLNTQNKEDGSNIQQVSGFNDEGFKNSQKSIDDITRKDSGTISNEGGGTDKGTITTHNRRYGNIGVTMTQQMINAELEVRPNMNIMNYIIDSYKNRFCLLVY